MLTASAARSGARAVGRPFGPPPGIFDLPVLAATDGGLTTDLPLYGCDVRLRLAWTDAVADRRRLRHNLESCRGDR